MVILSRSTLRLDLPEPNHILPVIKMTMPPAIDQAMIRLAGHLFFSIALSIIQTVFMPGKYSARLYAPIVYQKFIVLEFIKLIFLYREICPILIHPVYAYDAANYLLIYCF
jgi:hypothetical protein